MTIAAPFLYVVGGIFIGLCFPGFRRHPAIGSIFVAGGAILIILAVTNTTLTIPRPQIHYPNPTVSAPNGNQASNSNPQRSGNAPG